MMRRMLALTCLLWMALPAAAGTWTPNSYLYKPSTGARGEAEKRTFDTGLDRVDARLGKEIWVGDPGREATVQGAVTGVGGNQTLLRIPAGTWSINGNFTIPANVTLKPERGAILSIATGVTLTINGGLDVGLHQIFSWSGTGKVVFGPGAVKSVHPEWWGAIADNSADCTTAIQAALTACYNSNIGVGTVFLSAGRYKITAPLNVPIYTSMIGVSPEKTVIEATACDGLVFDSSAGSTSLGPKLFSGFTIHGTGCGTKSGIKSLGTADTVQKCEGLDISYLHISNFGFGMYFRNLWNGRIHHNYINNVNVGITIKGQCISNQINNNNIEYGVVTGATGTSKGVYLDSASDYAGGASHQNEGTWVSQNEIYAFTYNIHQAYAATITYLNNCLDMARTYGIYVEGGASGLKILANWIHCHSDALAGIKLNTGGNCRTAIIRDNTLAMLSLDAVTEVHTIPAVPPYTIAVTHAATFGRVYDVHLANPPGTVFYQSVAVPTPATMECYVANGVYTFNVAQAGVDVSIRYFPLTYAAVGIHIVGNCDSQITGNSIETAFNRGIVLDTTFNADVSHNDFFSNGGGGGASIYIKNIYLGGTVNVNDNACVMPIYVDPANNDGNINIGQQKIGNGIYYVRGKTVLPDHADTITTTYESQYGEVGVYAWPAIATWGIQPVARVMSTSSPLSGLSAVASATGITLTVPASPVHADTTIFWEVIAVPVIEYAH